ncbi:MAG: U32 family peptidase [Kiritimatiellae bacterium]|nr:U32 family peptidase [Kiritimatiellia bacterium]
MSQARKLPELLAPAGSFEVARAAFAAGADAVYLGLDSFSARAYAVNFSAEDLAQLVAYARALGRKVYVTFNTLVADSELETAEEKLALLDEIGPDGLIVQDLGVARLVRERHPSLALHASTQMAAHNLEGALLLKELGFKRVVLARELPIADVASIAKRAGVEIETFVHGALCYSLSGLCLFSAIERNRSGNRGQCAYCCRQGFRDVSGKTSLPFSMRDLRLDDALGALADAGVASLKIEGRMKSALYVSSVTSRYRQLLDGAPNPTSRADLETVFSRRTTELYARGWKTSEPVVDPDSLGHLGTAIGEVKRVTKDREGRAYLRFRTNRALEKHDGIQLANPAGGKPHGFGIAEMRLAISRKPVFEAPAGSDVELLLPDALLDSVPPEGPSPFKPGATVYCSASNEMKRRFPIPPFRPSDYPTGKSVDVVVTLLADGVRASAAGVEVALAARLAAAQHPERTADAVKKAFAKLGGTAWKLGAFTLVDDEKRFAPASLLNDLRRELVDALDDAAAEARAEVGVAPKTQGKQVGDSAAANADDLPGNVLKVRLGQRAPAGDWDEIVVDVGHETSDAVETAIGRLAEKFPAAMIRLALPVFTKEEAFNKLRVAVKHLLKAGHERWEAADLGGLRLLRQLGAKDVTADWTLYAFNAVAAAALADLGVKRYVVSPEATEPARPARIPGERLVQQSTPLFISATRPAAEDPSRLVNERGETFACEARDGLWVTTRTTPRIWRVNGAAIRRTDLSWDPLA